MPDSKKRRDALYQAIVQSGACSISSLAQRLEVSSMTIRRDLKLLEGMVRVYHGVVVLDKDSERKSDYELSSAECVRVDEKRRIAKVAASLVQAGDIVIIDGGSTTAGIAQRLPHGVPLTVICLSLNAFANLKEYPDIEVILAGGVFHRETSIFEGPESLSLLKRYRATKAFISAKGFREDLGVTCSSNYLLSIKQAALSSSVKKILVADSSKYGKVDTCFFAELDSFDAVVTDSGLPAEAAQSIRARGIEVILA